MMMRLPTLAELGERICIMGPPASGKSTLAAAIARKRAVACIHLDQLRHLPGTDWRRPRPDEDFAALHARAIAGRRWVIDGNYTQLLAPRLARATGLILLDVPTAAGLIRYLRRCWFERHRAGALEGGQDSAKWHMIRYILGPTRSNRARYARLFEEVALPKRRLATPRALQAFYWSSGLVR